jgi:ADP-heptose:LPS heptosyltransferase
MSFYQKAALFYVSLIKLFRKTVINVFIKLLFKKTIKYKKILVNRDGAFGDSIVALPALSIIRQNHPKAQIDLLSVTNNGVSFKDIGISHDLINKLYVINKSLRKEVLSELKKQNYDLFIQIPQNIGVYKSIRNMLLVRFYLKIKSAFGWDCGRIKSFMRLQKQDNLIVTETTRFINTLKQNDLYGDITYPLESLPPEDQQTCKLIQAAQPLTFLIGGKLQTKKWPLDHWVSLAKLIGDEQKILLAGGDEDIKDAEYIEVKSTNATSLCGKLSIPELRYVLEKSKLIISLDTGAMHLCDTTNTKLIALFSTRDLSNKWFPNNKSAVVIEKILPCSFCLKTECNNHVCMSSILPNEVYSNMNKLLNT